MHFLFFGPGRITDGHGKDIDLRGRKELALLAYLAVDQAHAHNRDTLIGLLWPELNQSDARNNLRVTLTRVRRALEKALPPGVDPLLANRRTLQLNPAAAITVDVHALHAHFDTALHHQHADLRTCPACRATIQQAVDLYRGEFLHGFFLEECAAFEDWLLIQRESYHVKILEWLPKLEAAYVIAGDLKAAADAVRHRLALDPLQEDAHRRLMELLVHSGQRHAALVQYETCRRRLEQELGVPPSVETMALYQQIRDGEILPHAGEGEPHLAALQGVAKAEQAAATGSAIAQFTPEQVLLEQTLPEQTASAAKVPAQNALLPLLDALPDQRLFGVATARAELLTMVRTADRPWLIAIDGIGGIGKSALARDLVHDLLGDETFSTVAWVSAKQEEFRPEKGIHAMTPQGKTQPALDVESFTAELLEQLSDEEHGGNRFAEQHSALTNLLKTQPSLVVVDNLETVADYQALVPYLRQLANPSKFVITSRFSLQAHADIFCLSLGELSPTDTRALLRHEATVRGIRPLADAADDLLDQIHDQIYAIVGGHPLALNLVLGQLSFLPLPHVLANLQAATSKRVDELYTYIYWQAWQLLDDAGRQLFLSLPLVYNGTFGQLMATSMLDLDELQGALSQLIGLSLVQIMGDLLEPRYRLHRLTETFLMHEVLKWQA
ncbi:MAG: BTAD domain-containing putative transcriptional regulator [Caldilineaceae bacterium]